LTVATTPVLCRECGSAPAGAYGFCEACLLKQPGGALAEGSSEAALSASPVASPLELAIANGARLVVYQYCVSALFVSFKRSSGVKLIRPDQNPAIVGLPYTLISLVAGWWGIPWGPFWTIKTAYKNLRGGIDVTPALVQQAAAPKPTHGPDGWPTLA
jgi:hypothetical protein